MKLSFHGADRDVTGSCHLVECGGRRVLIDCGLFQGGRELSEENAAPFGFDAPTIDINANVISTNANLVFIGGTGAGGAGRQGWLTAAWLRRSTPFLCSILWRI